MTTTVQPVTADDLLRMPDDGFRYQLVKGELRRTALAGHEHGRVTVRFTVVCGSESVRGEGKT